MMSAIPLPVVPLPVVSGLIIAASDRLVVKSKVFFSDSWSLDGTPAVFMKTTTEPG